MTRSGRRPADSRPGSPAAPKGADPQRNAASPALPTEDRQIPPPDPPRPNKRFLLVSAVLLLCWLLFLTWMAVFN